MFPIKTFQRFFHQLLQLYRPFENRLNIELSKHQLYRVQWSVLYYLYNFGCATLVGLADYLNIEKPNVTRTIHRLEEMGYVEHVPSRDKREKRMQLTDLGKKIYLEVRVTIDQYEQEILEGISEEEQLEAIRILGEIRKNILK